MVIRLADIREDSGKAADYLFVRLGEATTALSNSRKKLYIGAVTTLLIVVTGALPTEVESLGIQFSVGDIQRALIIAGVANIYFLLKFFLDSMEYRQADFLYSAFYQKLRIDAEVRKQAAVEASKSISLKVARGAEYIHFVTRFVFPLLVGLASIWAAFSPQSFPFSSWEAPSAD